MRESPANFERWMDSQRAQRGFRRGARTQAAYQIPVVVHVIHNGESLGSGANISDEQILSQISVLNKDYNRLNADAPNTPAEFQSVAGAFNVEFVMAKQDPEGLATTGIVRMQGTKSSWTMNDNYQLKALSYWPAEDYLNIWVCRLSDFLGYAQFPVSALPGLENSSTNRLTDGVVIAFNAFGSSDDGNFTLHNLYNKGRTTTHEVGHFFGLNHIWGDDDNSCSGTDYVDDTPNQSNSSSGCPAHPRITCDVAAMFQNYLDYTNDACMNLFTQGQVSRMEVVIENSPRRASLTTSHGLNDPAPIANDLGIREILRPAAGECTSDFTPQIEVRNYGSNDVVSARITLRKDGVLTETKDFTFTPALISLESRQLTFNDLSFTSGTHNVTIDILLVNGMADGQDANNTLARTFVVPTDIALPFIETFAALPPAWSILNPDGEATWELSTTASANGNALKMNFYDYEDHVGEIDAFVSPAFDLSDVPAALLKFDVAYAQFSGSRDGLQVVLLSDCNPNPADGIVLFNKTGNSLATTRATSTAFSPNDNDWRTETVDLSLYIGQSNLQLAFLGLNDWGNNLYLDNIRLTTVPIADVAATEILQPTPVTCASEVQPVVRVFNAGTLIEQLTVTTIINGVSTSQTFQQLSIPGNTSRDLILNSASLTEGVNQIQIVLSAPNDEPDFFPDDNSISITIVMNSNADAVPIRQRFDNDITPWISVNPKGGIPWQVTSINDNPALLATGFNNTAVGDRAWFVSPSLDFTGVSEGVLNYQHSYATRPGASDALFILGSRDCGVTFTDTLQQRGSASLARGRQSQSSWRPATAADWTANTLSLSSLADEPNARIAFVFVNGNGNNLYIDDIEFFTSADPIAINKPMDIYPSPVGHEPLHVTFNLPEKEDVRIDLIDVIGRVLNTYPLEGVLNQTYSFDLSYDAGLYHIRATTRSAVYIERFVVRQ